MFNLSNSGPTVGLVLFVAVVSACGGGAAPGPANSPPVPTASNVHAVSVDAGPADSGYNVNRLYTTVKVCQPDTNRCQTIDHVLVDTGSTGLRLLSSSLGSSVSLIRLIAGGGHPLLNCVQFLDATYAWGPVAAADVVLGGETALGVPIHIIADHEFDTAPVACAGGSTALTDAKTLGANGILGMGLFREDCGSGCVVNVHNGFYYTCTDASCTATQGATANLSQQLKNPVSRFASNNNGLLIELPVVSASGASSLTGSLIFGIGTQPNNQLASSVALRSDAWGYVRTLLAGTYQPNGFSNSFFDTGSNGVFFDSSTIPTCAQSKEFYCPVSTMVLSATLVGTNAATTAIMFPINDATVLFTTASRAAFAGLAGPVGEPSTFDWGLPFFFGRRVAIGIEGQSSPLGMGPYYAF